MTNIRPLVAISFLVTLGLETSIALPPQEIPAEVKVNRPGVVIAPPSQKLEPPTNPGRFRPEPNRCLGAIPVRPLPSAYTLQGRNAPNTRPPVDALMLIKLRGRSARSATGTGLLDPPPCLDRPGGLARKAAPASWKT